MCLCNEMEFDSENEIPYNPNNKNLVDCSFVESILDLYGVKYRVKNINTFINAFTHKSYIVRSCWTKQQLLEKKETFSENIIELGDRSYEELEFRGDAILDFVTVDYLTRRYPLQTEGFYTKLKSKMVNGVTLAKIARNLNFHKYVLISTAVEEKNGRYSEKILEDVFEAFIGALYHDSVGEFLENFHVCYSFIYNLLDNKNHDYDYASLILYDTNYKDQLLKFFHQNKWGNPVYVDVAVEENINAKIFNVAILDPITNCDSRPKYLVTGIGATKKKAEQLASKEALRFFGILLEDI